MNRKHRLHSAAGLLVGIAAIGLAACGESQPPAGPVPGAGAASSPAARAASAPERPRTLELPREGHPIVWVRPGKRVDLHAAPRGRVVTTVKRQTEFRSPTVLSVVQVRGRWAGVPTAHRDNGRLAWLRLDPARLRAGSTDLSIAVDLSERSAEVLRGKRVIRRFSVSIGAPGADTPTGRFAVTDTFRGGLNPVYGCCAVALTARQTRLPSGWLGGDLIAIHGTTGPLGQAISNGCVRAADRDVSALVNLVGPGTPVVISA